MAQPPLPAGARLGVDVRCGLLIKEGKTMRPDERKGLLRVLRTEDGLVHLQWHVRPDQPGPAAAPSADPPSSPPEHDAVVFPCEARFEPLLKGPPRVWALRFAAEKDRNLFFWMQEPDAAGDEARGRRVDALINAPLPGMEEDQAEGAEAAAAAAAARGGGGGGDPWLTPADALARAHEAGGLGAGTEMIAGDSVGLLAQGPGQRAPVEVPGGDAAAQLAALLSGMAGGAGVGGGGGGRGGGFGGGGASAADPGNALAQALAAALARSAGAGGGAGGLGMPPRADPGPTLLDVLRPDAVAAALTSGPPAAAAPTGDAPAPPAAAEGDAAATAPAPKKSPLEEAAERLDEFLPEGSGQRGAQGLIDNVRSPQFRAQVASLAHALATGQIDLAATFGLTSAQGGYSMHDFVRALEDLVKKEKEEREGKPPPGGG